MTRRAQAGGNRAKTSGTGAATSDSRAGTSGAHAKTSGTHAETSGAHAETSGAHAETSGTHAETSGTHAETSGTHATASRTRAAGIIAEDLAADYLQERGLRLIERNYHCRLGEIDLVLADGPALVFAEVRLRRSKAYGGAAASITAAKRQRILHAARHYLSGKPERPCRFDVLLLDALDPGSIEWIKDAFGE